MKKLISILLCVMLVLSALPFAAVEAAAGGSMQLNQEYSVSCSSAGTWDVRTFVPSESGIYIFSSSGSLDTLGYIALAEGEAENQYIKADGGQDNNFAVTYDMRAGTTYYLGSTVLMGATGTYRIKIVKFEVDDGTIPSMDPSTTTSVTTYSSNKVRYMSYVPEKSGKYIYTATGNYDTRGYIFDEYWQQIAYAGYGGAGSNFKIEIDLQASKTYYLGYAAYYSGTAKFNLSVQMTTAIKGVSLVSAPKKNAYIKDLDATLVSESSNLYHVDLNLRDFAFRVNYVNGTAEEKVYSYGIRYLTCETSQNLHMGTNSIPFYYMNFASSFVITVKETPVQSLSMLQPPDKQVYYKEDVEVAMNNERIFNISLYGMCIRAVYKDGTTTEFTISSSYGEEEEYFHFNNVVPEADMHIGDNTFVLSYYGVELPFTVRYSLNSENWEYRLEEDHAVITKYIGKENRAVIPDELGGYPVTVIGEGCFKDKTALTSVKMNNNIVSIEKDAFLNCSSLKELTLPENLSSIGTQALMGLTSLENLYWKTKNTLSIAKVDKVFASMGDNTQNGTTVEFCYECEAIPANAFYVASNYSPNITKIIVGENVRSIGGSAFRELKNLQLVEWNAANIPSLTSGNNIWTKSAPESSFEVHIGEYVQSLPKYLFHASQAANAPRVSKYVVNSKDTTVDANTFKINSEVACTFYCYYNEDTSVKSVYKLCTDNNYSYELLDAQLESIFLSTTPEKTEYIIGETLDLTGITVYAVFDDASQKEVTEEITVTGFDTQTPGWQDITVSYTCIGRTRSAVYRVLVSREPLVLQYITITQPARKTAFFEGDYFESDGLCVEATFDNGLVQDISEYIIVEGYNMNQIGTQSVVVSYSYEEITASVSYDIFVNELVLTGLRITATPDKTDYLVGEALNLDGLEVTADYNSGKTAIVTPYCEITGYDMSTKGTQTVTVFYTDRESTQSASFEIVLSNDLQRISVDTTAGKTLFVKEQPFSSEGISVTAYYENGTQAEVSHKAHYSGYEPTQLGTQTISVQYEEDGISKTASYTIEVELLSVSALEIVSVPTAQQFVREQFHTEGLQVNALYNDGTSENVTESLMFSGFDNTRTGTQTVTAAYTFAGKTVSAQISVYVNDKHISGIELSKKPEKKKYLLGESFDESGMQVDLCFDNGTKEALSPEQLTLSGFESTSAGTKTITVRYHEDNNTYSTSFYVTVSNYEIGISVNAPAKTSYFYGEAFEKTGMSVVLYMADGTQKTVYSGYTLGDFSPTTLGTQQIEVVYISSVTEQQLHASFGVEVNNFALSLSVTPPTTTDYFYAEAINPEGMRAVATMADGSTRDIDTDALSLSGYSATTLGTQQIIASYQNEKGESISDSFEITLNNYETELYVTPPSKTVYYYGETLRLAGLSARAKNADASMLSIRAAQLSVSGYDATVVGTQQLSVAYTNAKGEQIYDSFTVTVRNYEEEIAVHAPNKTEYYYGESLDTTGMYATATMANGESRILEADALSLSGYSATVTGNQTVTVSFTDERGYVLRDSFAVNVRNFETALVITNTGKTVYAYGESFDDSELVAKVLMADGSEQAVAKADLSVSGYQAYEIGEQTVEVGYLSVKGELLSDTYTVIVNNVGTAIKVTAPDKTVYFYGEALDTTGMGASLENEDGSLTVLDTSLLSVSGYRPTVVGEQNITVSYTGSQGEVLKDRFKVQVLNYETALEVVNEGKTDYYYGDNFDASALEVRAVMADGSRSALENSALTLSGYAATTLGEQSISVKYTNAKAQVISTSYIVTLNNYETSILILTSPTKKQYYYGEPLDTTGIKAGVRMADGSVKQVGAETIVCTDYDAQSLGEQQVSANIYTAKGTTLSKTFKVTVNNYETAIVVTAPIKTSYFYGESMNTAGMKVKAVMADGTQQTLAANAYTHSAYNAQELGTQQITVSYTGVKGEVLTDSFEVINKNYEADLIITPPDKTQYDYGEALDTAGMCVTAVMADGSTNVLEAQAYTVSDYVPGQLGIQSVSVSILGAKGERIGKSFEVQVNNFEMALSINAPDKTQYDYGEALDLTGINAQVVMADGSLEPIAVQDLVVDGYQPTQLGAQSISVSIQTQKGERLSETFGVYVNNYLADILITADDEAELLVNSPFSAQALVSAVMADGSTYPVSNNLQFSGYDMAQTGEQTVTVSYSDGERSVTGEYTVRVVTLQQRADVNRDGCIDIGDISVILAGENFALATDLATSARADVNMDATIEVKDISIILMEENYGQTLA